MKHLYFSFLLCFAYILFPENSSAQYQSIFGKELTTWIIKPGCYSYSYGLSMVKDTVLFGMQYKEIFGEEEVYYDFSEYHTLYLREDTSSGKLWVRNIYEQIEAEHLIMDLSLEKGDTFHITSFDGRTTFIIADSVYLTNDGRKIICFNAKQSCGAIEPFFFLEGTGPSHGFIIYNIFATDELTEVDGLLMCQFKDKKHIYNRNAIVKNCGMRIVSVEENSNIFSIIKLYPNPVSSYGILSFNNEGNINTTFSIIDVSGKCIYQCQSRENKILFTTETMQAGTYFYKLQSEHGLQANGSFIKQ